MFVEVFIPLSISAIFVSSRDLSAPTTPPRKVVYSEQLCILLYFLSHANAMLARLWSDVTFFENQNFFKHVSNSEKYYSEHRSREFLSHFIVV